MGKTYRFCQSCSMPLEQKGKDMRGTEKDGKKSVKYCTYCYQKGVFLSPEIKTAQEMQEFCIQQMKKGGMNAILAWLLTRTIPSLERWKKLT